MSATTKITIELILALAWMLVIQTRGYVELIVRVLDGTNNALLRGSIASFITVSVLSLVLLYVEPIAELLKKGDVLRRTGQSFWELHGAVLGSVGIMLLLQQFGVLAKTADVIALPYTEGAIAVFIGFVLNLAINGAVHLYRKRRS